MRGTHLGVVFAGLLLALPSRAGAETLAQCEPARTPLEKLICAHPDLRAADRKIIEQDEKLRRQYGGEDARVFEIVYLNWRNIVPICAQPGLWTYDKLAGYRCAKDRFDKRLQLLAGLVSGRANIQDAATKQYPAEPWYVNALSKQFERRTVNVSAEIDITDCDKPDTPNSVVLRTPRSLMRRMSLPASIAKEATIQFRFDRMQEAVKDRLCEKRPYTDWTGTVMLDHGKPYLYAPELFW
jgi:hypothetical protein